MQKNFSEAVVKTLLQSQGGAWVSAEDVKGFLAKQGAQFEDFKNCTGDVNKLIEYNDMFTTSDLSGQENRIAKNILRLMMCGTKRTYSRESINGYIKEYEAKTGMKFHESQADAIAKLCNSPGLGILIGGPGTGKTTTVQCVLYCKRKLANGACSIVLTAPTGKAANRLAESTGENTCTLHKKVLCKADKKRAFLSDVLVVDEASMIDMDLADKLFEMFPTGKDIILIGDTEQLPSVGWGAILRDIIASGVVPVAQLTKTFRQDNSSKLFTCINNLKNGIAEIPDAGAEGDVHPIVIADELADKDAEKAALEKTLEVYKNAVDKYGKEQVACLIPYRSIESGKLCSQMINPLLQEMCNKENEANSFCGYRLGDLIIQLVNREECANGDVGKVIKVTNTSMSVEYATCTVTYNSNELDQISLAYAMSIHKSQGSEYKHVIVVLLNEHEAMQQRNLIYTGVTRAKKECTVIYQKKAMETAVKHIADENRKTMLAEKLRVCREQYRMVYGI